MVYQILIISKTLIPFIRLSNYAFHREDISFSKHMLSDTRYGVITIQMYSSTSTITLNMHEYEYEYSENKCTRVRLL